MWGLEMSKSVFEKSEIERLKEVRTGFQITLNFDEKRQIKEAAERAGVQLAVFIRDAALEKAKRQR